MKICTAGFPCWETQKGRLGTPRTRKALVGHQGIRWALWPAGLPRSFTAAASNRSQLGLGCAPPPTRLRQGPLPRGRPGAGPAEAARPPGFGPQRPGRARSHLLTQPRAVPRSMINRPRSAHQETRAVRESGAGPDGGGGRRAAWLVAPWTQVRAAVPGKAGTTLTPGPEAGSAGSQPGPALGPLSLPPGAGGTGGCRGKFGDLGRAPLRRAGAPAGELGRGTLGLAPGRAADAPAVAIWGVVFPPNPHAPSFL